MKFARLLGGATLAAILAACVVVIPEAANSGASSKYPAIPAGPITIGLSVSLTGPLASSGKFLQETYEQVTVAAFKKEYPKGIEGHQIVVDYENDGGDPTTGAEVAKKFVSEHVAAVMHVSDLPEVGDIQMAILNKAHIPTITYDTSAALSNAKAYPYNFGVSVSNAQQSESGLNYLKSHPQYKRIAILTDNTPVLNQEYNAMLNPLVKAGKVKVVATASVNDTTLDYSSAIAQLKAANPQMVLVFVNGTFGNVWQAMNQADWSPPVIGPSYIFYDGYSALGAMKDKALVLSAACAPTSTPVFPARTSALMSSYAAATEGASPNMLVYVQTDSVGLELLKYAVTKYDSTSPDAIKTALESFNQDLFWQGDHYHFTPTNHYGLSGVYGSAVCQAAPLVDGANQIPLLAK
jgi:ABC-type branched-subunit amino acid transport system substrate-binding protein